MLLMVSTLAKLQSSLSPEQSSTQQAALLQNTVDSTSILPSELNLKAELGKDTPPAPRIGLVWPTKYALSHPAAPLLEAYSRHGSPVDAGPPWSPKRIDTALP